MTLERSAHAYAPWVVRNGLGLASLAAGAVSLLVAYWLQFGGHQAITQVPDLRVTLPLLAVSLGAGVWSFVRRERARALPIAGMAMASAAAVLGWLILVAAVAAVALIALIVIAKFH